MKVITKLLLALTLFIAMPCYADIVAQYTGNPTNTAAELSGTYAHARSFIITGNAGVTEIQLYLRRWSGTAGTVVVELCSDTKGLPTSSCLKVLTKSVTDVPDQGPGWVSFAWASGQNTPLVPGRYWIVATLNSGSDAIIDWEDVPGNPYGNANDEVDSDDSGSTWKWSSLCDNYFKVIGARTPSVTHVTITPDPAAIDAGGDSTLTITVKDAANQLIPGTGTLGMTATAGSFSNASPTLQDGVATTIWTAPGAVGNPQITASFGGLVYGGVDYQSSSGNKNINVSLSNKPTTTTETLNPPTVYTYSPITVSVVVKDNQNQLVPRGTVSFSCSNGRFSSNSVAVQGGAASTTWTAGRTAGSFTIKASYAESNPGQGGIVYGPSEDHTKSVTVNPTPLATNTTVSVSPDYPYIGGTPYVTVEVFDQLGNHVPGGNVQLSSPSGAFSQNPLVIKGGIGITYWIAPDSEGDVAFTADYQQTDLGGYRYGPSTNHCTAHVMKDHDSTGAGLSTMIEWNTNYSSKPLKKTKGDAEGFLYGLGRQGWNGFAYSNGESWETDMKGSSAGGDENNYMDTHDFTYYSGHGNPDYITFITPHDDTQLYAWEAHNAWGDKDAEWVAFSACLVMCHPADWKSAMHGLHMICGFTDLENDMDVLGGYFADLLTQGNEHDKPHGVAQSWFLASAMSNLNINNRVLAENDTTYNDFIWGQGPVAADPAVDDDYVTHDANMPRPGGPMANAGGPYFAVAGQAFNLNGTCGNSDIGDAIFYIWDTDVWSNTDSGDWDNDGVDDAHDDADLWGPNPSCIFSNPGDYTVRLMTFDNNWWFSYNETVVHVLPGNAKAKPSAPRTSDDDGMEVIDRYPSIPPEMIMPTFKFNGATIGYNEMANIAGYYGMQGCTADLNSDLGNWETSKGDDDLIVNQNSAAVMFLKRSRAFTYLGPAPAPPPDSDAVSAAEAFMTVNSIQHPGSVLNDVEYIDYRTGNTNTPRSFTSTFTYQKYVTYRRTLSVGAQTYPVVGPGGHIGILVDQTGDVVMYNKVWRDVYQYGQTPLTGAPMAIQKLHDLGVNALIANPGIPESCTKLYVDNVSLGYYEEDFSKAQSTVYPVYILDMTVEDEKSTCKVQGYMWAYAPPIEVTITSPSPGTEVDYGQSTIQLTGSAAGGTPPYTYIYVWDSDVEGYLGTGPSISVTLGRHQKAGTASKQVITLTVTDQNGMTGSKTVDVTVKPTDLEDGRLRQDGSPVWLLGQITTADFASHYYVEKPDRSAGIAVAIDPHPDLGDMMSIAGTISTLDGGERVVTNGDAEVASTGNDIPTPLFLRNAFLGGKDLNGYALGIPGCRHLYNLGLLVTAYGRVTYADADCFYIDDGSALDDGSGHIGVKVYQGGLTPPEEDDYAVVTGISSEELSPNGIIRVLRPRIEGDIIWYSPE